MVFLIMSGKQLCFFGTDMRRISLAKVAVMSTKFLVILTYKLVRKATGLVRIVSGR